MYYMGKFSRCVIFTVDTELLLNKIPRVESGKVSTVAQW